MAWTKVNFMAKINVIINPSQASSLDPQTIAWCAHVKEIPESNNKKVFNNGTDQGLKVVKKAGGQIPPITILGLKLK